MRHVDRRAALLGAVLASGVLLTGCPGGDDETDSEVGTSDEVTVEPDPTYEDGYDEPDTTYEDLVEPDTSYDDWYDEPDTTYVDPVEPDTTYDDWVEPAPDPTVRVPYQDGVLPEDDPAGVERCSYAGDPLCDTTIDVPPPLLPDW